jgi:hypothetical protein
MLNGVHEELLRLVDSGFVVHVPPAGACASIHYPCWALFLVVTRPGIEVKWLPEQMTGYPELKRIPIILKRSLHA